MARDVVRLCAREVARRRRDLLERAPATRRRDRAHGRLVTADPAHHRGGRTAPQGPASAAWTPPQGRPAPCPNVARPPAVAAGPAVSSPPPGKRPETPPAAPWTASAWAMARPVPEPPPVTKALPPKRLTGGRAPRPPSRPPPASRAGSCGRRAAGAARRP